MKKLVLVLFLLASSLSFADNVLQPVQQTIIAADVSLVEYAFLSDEEAVYITLTPVPGLTFAETYTTALLENGPFFKTEANLDDASIILNADGYRFLDTTITVEVTNSENPRELDFLIIFKTSYKGVNSQGEEEIARETQYIEGKTVSSEHELEIDLLERPEFYILDDGTAELSFEKIK